MSRESGRPGPQPLPQRQPLRVEGPDPQGLCWARCIHFKCNKRALEIRAGRMYCTWFQADCLGPSCIYADCFINKRLPDNRCALVLTKPQLKKFTPSEFKIDVKLPPKALRKVGTEEDLV